MLDPFTLASGLVGLMSLAIQLTQVTAEYSSAAINATASITKLATEFEILAGVLREVQSFLKEQNKSDLQFQETAVIYKTKIACKASLEEAQRKLVSRSNATGLKKIAFQARWPMDEKSTKRLALDLQRYSSTFRFSLSIQGFGVLSKTSTEVSEILKTQIQQLEVTKGFALSLPDLVKQVQESLERFSHMLDLLSSPAFTDPMAKVEKLVDEVASLINIQAKLGERHDIVALAERKDRLMTWLTPTDPSLDYLDAMENCLSDSGSWLLSNKEFKDWSQTPRSLLWLHGVAGCGKTTLISTITSYFLADNTSPKVAYYYFDFNDPNKRSVLNFICSCISQLCSTIPTKDFPAVVQGLEHHAYVGTPTRALIAELLVALDQLLLRFLEVVILVDAIDVCDPETMQSMSIDSILRRILETRSVHVVVTSTHQSSIVNKMERLATTKIAVEGSAHKADIGRYIDYRLDHGTLQTWSKAARASIRISLMSSAGNLFRWVTLQLDSLERCLTLPVLRRSLRNLPRDLFGTYKQLLSDLDENYRELALVALQWLVYTDFPMTIESIAQVMAVSLEPPRSYSPVNRLRSPDDVLSVCAGLVSIQYQSTTRIVRPAHSTVQEYITTGDVPGLPPPSDRKAYARELIAQCCLAFLRYLDSLACSDSQPCDRFPQSLRWYISNLDWVENLISTDDMIWVLQKALFPSQGGQIKTCIQLRTDLSSLLDRIRYKLRDSDYNALWLKTQEGHDIHMRSLFKRISGRLHPEPQTC